MPEYILRLIAEAKNHSDALDMKVNGNVLGVGDVFTLDKEYPPCVVTYQVTSVSPMNIKVPKNPIPVYQADVPVVSALRVLSGFEKKQ